MSAELAAEPAAAALPIGPPLLTLTGLGLCAWITSVGFPLRSAATGMGADNVGRGALLLGLFALLPLGLGACACVLARLPLTTTATFSGLSGSMTAAALRGAAGLMTAAALRGAAGLMTAAALRGAARLLLLAAYPAALALALAAWPEAELSELHNPLSVSLAALCLLAYLAGAAGVTQEPKQLMPAEVFELGPRGQRQRPLRLRTALIVASSLGAFAIAVVAPLSSTYSELSTSWSEAAAAGSVLSAVVAGALGASVLAIFLGASLRLDLKTRPLPRAERNTRVAAMLFLAMLGALVFYTVT